MRNPGKAIIVIALVIAVAAILMGKRNGATPAPPPAAAREVATASPTEEASPAPVAESAEPAASPLATQKPTPTAPTASAPAAPPAPSREETAPKPHPRTSAPKPEPAKPQGAPKTVKPSQEERTPSPPSSPARRPRLIELGSKTCIPCKMMQPILDELRRDYGSQLEVIFYDIYERRDMAEAYQIRVIPTQVFLDAEGKEFFRHQGFYPKEDILARFEEHGIVLVSK